MFNEDSMQAQYLAYGSIGGVDWHIYALVQKPVRKVGITKPGLANYSIHYLCTSTDHTSLL